MSGAVVQWSSGGVFLKVIVKMVVLVRVVRARLGVLKKQTPIHILIWKCFRLIFRQRYILLEERGNKIPLEIKKRNLEI